MASYLRACRPGDHAVPKLLNEYTLGLQFVTQGLRDIHVKTRGLAIVCFVGERFVGGGRLQRGFLSTL